MMPQGVWMTPCRISYVNGTLYNRVASSDIHWGRPHYADGIYVGF